MRPYRNGGAQWYAPPARTSGGDLPERVARGARRRSICENRASLDSWRRRSRWLASELQRTARAVGARYGRPKRAGEARAAKARALRANDRSESKSQQRGREQ